MSRPKTFLLKNVLTFAAAISFALCALGLPPANLPPVPNTVDSITPTELRMHLEFLASDELGGRYTLSPNFGIAARYLAAHLEAYGFRGAGDHGSFLQTFEVVAAKPDKANSALTLTIGDKTGNNGKDADGDVAVAWPRPDAPILIGAYVQGGTPTPQQIEAVFADIGRMVGGMHISHGADDAA